MAKDRDYGRPHLVEISFHKSEVDGDFNVCVRFMQRV